MYLYVYMIYGFPYISTFRRGKSPSFWSEFWSDILDRSRRSFSNQYPRYIYLREENDELEAKEGKKNSMRATIDFYMVFIVLLISVLRYIFVVFLEYFLFTPDLCRMLIIIIQYSKERLDYK